MRGKLKVKQKKAKSKERVGRRKFGSGLAQFDFSIFIITLGLLLFGLLMVFSASYYWSMSKLGSPYKLFFRQLVWVLLSILVMLIFSKLPYKILQKHSKLIFVIGLVLLFLVFTPLGIDLNGAKRWIGVGGVTIMPGELAKFCAVVLVAAVLTKANVNSLKILVAVAVTCGAYVVLIMLQPNMSTAATLAGAVVVMLFVAGLNKGVFLGGLGVGVVGVIVLILTSKYRAKRLMAFLDPFADPTGDAYQVVQSLLALGSGKWFGKGIGNSVQKTLYLPEPQNDFILAIIGEELGYVGVLLLLILYIILIYRGFKISLESKDKFGLFLGVGITSLLALQVCLNIAVVTSSMPATGIALPFISYGGNSTLFFGGAMGILLNISKQNKKNKNIEQNKNILTKEIYI